MLLALYPKYLSLLAGLSLTKFSSTVGFRILVLKQAQFFCGVFDGHGVTYMVAKRVRDLKENKIKCKNK
jgi:hypothetical protein